MKAVVIVERNIEPDSIVIESTNDIKAVLYQCAKYLTGRDVSMDDWHDIRDGLQLVNKNLKTRV